MRILVVVIGAVALAAAFAGADVARVGSTTAATSPPREPARPKPPAGYTVPRGAVRVSSAAQLITALTNPRRRDIVLAPGVYDSPGPFSSRFGHRLYAARLGKALFRAGISFGASSGGSGALVRGVVFDVRERAKTLNGAIVEVWGSSTNVRVLDTVLRGNSRLTTGILARQPAGFVAKRIVARSFTDYGVVVDANEFDRRPRRRPRFLLEDLDVANVARQPPRSSNGSAEACVWIGESGVARRVRVRNCGWMGVWTGTSATRTVVEDVDVDRTRTGIYIEHFTRDSTFQRLRVRSRVRIGIVAEWASPGWGGRPASVDNVIQDSTFESYLCGVYLDEGTTRTTVRRSEFRSQVWAAIGDYRGNDNRFSRNDYSGIRRTAVPVSHDHVTAARDRG